MLFTTFQIKRCHSPQYPTRTKSRAFGIVVSNIIYVPTRVTTILRQQIRVPGSQAFNTSKTRPKVCNNYNALSANSAGVMSTIIKILLFYVIIQNRMNIGNGK